MRSEKQKCCSTAQLVCAFVFSHKQNDTAQLFSFLLILQEVEESLFLHTR